MWSDVKGGDLRIEIDSVRLQRSVKICDVRDSKLLCYLGYEMVMVLENDRCFVRYVI
jgi:hypothetical protein